MDKSKWEYKKLGDICEKVYPSNIIKDKSKTILFYF